MMGTHEGQKELFSYSVDLDRRVRTDHPLRRVLSAMSFTFARVEVAHTYGDGGGGHVRTLDRMHWQAQLRSLIRFRRR